MMCYWITQVLVNLFIKMFPAQTPFYTQRYNNKTSNTKNLPNRKNIKVKPNTKVMHCRPHFS